MLSTILLAIASIKNLLIWMLSVSYYIGQIAYKLIHLILTVLFAIAVKSASVLNILFDDFGVFCLDLLTRIYSVLLVLAVVAKTIGEHAILGLYRLYTCIAYVLSIGNGILYIVESIFLVVEYVLVKLKDSLILLGNGAWFALTLLPNLLIVLNSAVVDAIIVLYTKLHEYIILKTVKIFNWICFFLNDIPMESMFALCIVSSLIFYGYKRQYAIRRYLRHSYLLGRAKTSAFLIRTKLFVTSLFKSTSQDEDMKNNGDDTSEETRLCIICQENDKCIVLLPCRHLCLCVDCTETHSIYQNFCPICRTVIKRRLMVYT